MALLLLVASILSRARAEEPSMEAWLRVDARGDHCVSAGSLQTEVARLLDARRPRRALLHVSTSERGWIIELWHADGQRAVREFPVLPEDCEERLRTLALAVVLAAEYAVETPPEPAREASPAAPTIWSLGVHAGGSLGELPTLAPALGLEARVERGTWVPVELLALVNVRSADSALAGATLHTRQITGALGTCLGGSRASWRIDGCLGVELGAVLGYGASLPRARRDAAGTGAPNLAVAARWSPRPHLAVTARIEGFVRFWVPQFQVLDAQGALYEEQRLPLAGGRLRLGFSWLSR